MDNPSDRPSDDYFIPLDHLAVIGRIANAWATFEFTIDRTTWRLADLPDMYGACLTAQMSSAHIKMRGLLALMELRGLSAKTLAAWKKFHSETISGLQERRNRTVHDVRMKAPDGEPARLQITAQGPLVFGFQPEPTADLKDTLGRI